MRTGITGKVLSFLTQHPRSSSADIASALNDNVKRMSVYLNGLHRAKNCRVVREVNTDPASACKYLYSINPKAVIARPTKRVEAEPIKVTATTLDISINDIGAAIAKQIIASVIANLAKEIPSLEDLKSRLATPTQQPQGAKLKRIAIVGLLANQAGLIQSEFYDAYDLRFWNDTNGDGIDKLKSMCAGSDLVILHVAHMSHRTQEIVKQSGVPFERIGGGVTRIKEFLLNLYANQ